MFEYEAKSVSINVSTDCFKADLRLRCARISEERCKIHTQSIVAV